MMTTAKKTGKRGERMNAEGKGSREKRRSGYKSFSPGWSRREIASSLRESGRRGARARIEWGEQPKN